jgi:hypothetical protein
VITQRSVVVTIGVCKVQEIPHRILRMMNLMGTTLNLLTLTTTFVFRLFLESFCFTNFELIHSA